MKLLILLLMVFLVACDKTSSPEGRMTIKIEEIQKELETLRNQNAAIMDSLGRLREDLRKVSAK